MNPHAFRRHPLKMVCLPVPPLPHGVNYVIKNLASSSCEGISDCTGFCTDSLHAMRFSGRCKVCQSRQQLVDRSLPGVYAAHRGLNVIVSGDILQCKGVLFRVVRVLPGLGQKSMTHRVQAGIGMSLDLFPLLRGVFLLLMEPRCRLQARFR